MAVRNAENGVVWGGYGALKVNGNVTTGVDKGGPGGPGPANGRVKIFLLK